MVDTSKFGVGFITEKEKTDKFFLDDGLVTYDAKGEVGGAVPVRGYDGPWPVFGKAADSWESIRDAVLDTGGSSSSSSSPSSSVLTQRPRMICRSTGRCSACPRKELHTPYCQPYGNRAPIECRPIAVLEAQTKPEPHKPAPAGIKSDGSNQGVSHRDSPDEHKLWSRQEPVISSTLYKGYQNCGRDRVQETWDYSEFIAFNLLLALGGLMLLLNRQRKLAGQHRAMLARRIGRI